MYLQVNGGAEPGGPPWSPPHQVSNHHRFHVAYTQVIIRFKSPIRPSKTRLARSGQMTVHRSVKSPEHAGDQKFSNPSVLTLE